ncbi:MAG: hypothetical protein ACTH6Z_05520 [Psychrobacter sp.]
MSLETAKDYLENYKKDTAIQYINVCIFLELLIDFEQTNLEEIITYLNINSFPTTTTLYTKNKGYINPKGDNENDCQSTCNFFNEIDKVTSFSVITGFAYEEQEKYENLYFSLLELFQSSTLKQVNFIKKYAAHEAMGRGFGYLSKGSIGSLFRSNELVTGLSQKRIDELTATEHIVKVKIDYKTDSKEATDLQKIVIARIHEYMNAQMKSYNASPTHRDEISKFLTDKSSDGKTTIKSDKELIAELQAKVADLDSQLVEAKKNLNDSEQVISNKDEFMHPRTANNASKIIAALTNELLKMDITQPFAKNSNGQIMVAIEKQGNTVSKDVIAHWLKLAHENSI